MAYKEAPPEAYVLAQKIITGHYPALAEHDVTYKIVGVR